MSVDWVSEAELLRRSISADWRNEIIEECANLVEGWSVPWQMVPSIAELAAAIRELKEKAS